MARGMSGKLSDRPDAGRPTTGLNQGRGKRVLVILGHPQGNSFCGAIAHTYANAAREAGAEVQQINLGELQFDPILWQGYRQMQELEPDLVEAQTAIQWADHLVFVYPNWWGSMPALLKGFLDRVLLPGFAFKYRQDSPFWDRLLAGRTAHLFVTMDTPPWYYRWIFKQPGHEQMRRTVLEFCGVKPVKITEIGPIRHASPRQREKWLAKVKALATSRPRRFPKTSEV